MPFLRSGVFDMGSLRPCPPRSPQCAAWASFQLAAALLPLESSFQCILAHTEIPVQSSSGSGELGAGSLPQLDGSHLTLGLSRAA